MGSFDTETEDYQEGILEGMSLTAERQNMFKLGLMGTAGCGKSAILSNFMDRGEFDESYEPTIMDSYE